MKSLKNETKPAKYETSADREENLRLEDLEKFERHIFDDYLHALSRASTLSPEEILAVLHYVTFDFLYEVFKKLSHDSIQYRRSRKYRGLTPLEIAFSFYVTDDFSPIKEMENGVMFDPGAIERRAEMLNATQMAAWHHNEFI